VQEIKIYKYLLGGFMASNFLKYLDNIEKNIIKDEEIIVETIIKSDENIKDKLIYELTEFGLDFDDIKIISNNIFESERKSYKQKVVENKQPSNFKENVNKLNKKKQETPVDHASAILDGLEDINTNVIVENQQNVTNINNFNMNNVAEHASALL
jgi:hypothetical protein